MSTPACVLFDLDGVLANYDHGVRVRVLGQRSGATEAEVQAALFDSGLEEDADLGRYDAAQQSAELARRLGRPLTLGDCVDARAAAMTTDPDMVALASAVSRRATVAILTNNGLLVREHIGALCPSLLPLFAGRVFCSAQFRVAKPDPAVFTLCLAQLGHGPEATLFIDDKMTNIAGARAAGLRVHHYRGIAGLSALLHELDLMEPDHAAT